MESSGSSSSSDSCHNGSPSSNTESSCDCGDSSEASGSIVEAVSEPSSASCGERVPTAHMHGHLPPISQGSAPSEGLQSAYESRTNNESHLESRDSNKPDASGESTRDSKMSSQTGGLASRLIAWRVVPLVSESLIRTEDISVLGVTAS